MTKKLNQSSNELSEFDQELERRLSILESKDYNDESLKHLQKSDFYSIFVILALVLLIMVWGWY